MGIVNWLKKLRIKFSFKLSDPPNAKEIVDEANQRFSKLLKMKREFFRERQ